jgi:hypothetical protein
MKIRPIFSLLSIAALLLVAGCQSVDDRIKEKPDVYAQLDRPTQDKIKQGIIDLGYTQDMVYLALGDPDEKRAKYDANERSATWVYNTYYERYNGTSFMGYYRQVYYDPYVKTYRVYYRPAYADTYVSEKEERIRVVFNDGRVTAIEQSRD